MKLNEAKCKYMIFSRSKEKFTTRLKINGENLERISAIQLLGVWIAEDLSWDKNCRDICKRAYSRLSLITKLKYVGVCVDDLLDIYKLFIRSITEYCSVLFHSSLTQQQSNKLEAIQKTCLKVIYGETYTDYETALQMSGLQTLSERRLTRCLDFSLKCLNHEKMSKKFPKNPNFCKDLRFSELFIVNFANTTSYQKSAIPFCQRSLKITRRTITSERKHVFASNSKFQIERVRK